MKKILITTSGFPLHESDGESQFMLEYAKSLQAHYEVFVLAPKARKSKKQENWNGIQVYRHRQSPLFNAQLAYGSGIIVNIRKNPLLLFCIPSFIILQCLAIFRICKRHEISLVNAHWWLPQGFCMAICRMLGLKSKFLLTIHSGSFWDFGKFPFKAFRNFTLKKADAVIGIGKHLEEGAASVIGSKAKYLPLGVHLNRYAHLKPKEELIRQFHLEGKTVLTLIGAMIERKGVRQMLSAFEKLVEIHPESTLLYVGEGALLDQLKQQVEKKGLKDKVLFAGRVNHEHIPDYLSVTDLLCVPSFSEGYPVVVKEAMASGVLVMSSELPGLTKDKKLDDIIYYFREVNENDILNKLKEILSNLNAEDARKDAGRKYMEKYGDWSNLGQEFANIAESI